MTRIIRRPSSLLVFGAGLGAAVGLLAVSVPAGATAYSAYQQVNLVSDVPGLAQVTDPHLVNAWGASYLGASPLWVSDNGTDVTTLYSGGVDGSPQTIVPLVVSIPGGAPTGQVSNATTSFVVHDAAGHSAPARFLFVGETGHLSGWNPAVGGTGAPPSTHAVDAVVTPGAVDKGMAMGQTADGPQLYVADFSAGVVDVYNGEFQRVITKGNFMDSRLPRGYAPFNVMVAGDKVYVAYAKQDSARVDEVAGDGRGRVDVFTLDGVLLRRLASHGVLNAPWGLTIAPTGFGAFSGDLLVGNFGDGRINAFDPTTLTFAGAIRTPGGRAVAIDGLWALLPGNGTEASTHDVLFTAGPQDEAHGLLGLLRLAP
ncbi:TIGR03118 family protein [Pedococcus sp. 5OH_020]|uniref:TIGR03118 family protein n=1 Tax=Pedococcus sp. 5OH_020 TaxID=2989814 RepID=UPI0022E9C62F|nr:TIGR03118 family protein [Pedococcus sp. 5OH_020]